MMITGGGTGGHTSPAVAIIEELQKRDPRLVVQWIGRRRGIEQRVCTRIGVPFRSVLVEGWPRGSSGQEWAGVFRLKPVLQTDLRIRQGWVAGKLALGIARSMLYITRFRPQVVVGVGGYVSLPLCYAAQRMGVPTVLHEQNKRLGMANRLLAARATHLFLSYPDTLGDYPKDRASVVGNPVRTGFASPPTQADARSRLGLDPAIPVVLVCGGSQGAHTLNAAMMNAVPQFGAGEAQFLWMTGKADAVEARAAMAKLPVRVEVFPFIDDMVTACAASDLIVGRAGASSAAEISVLGKPSILVPYPHATDNHQEQNARAFEEVGGAVVMLDQECTGDRLAREIRGLIGDRARLGSMAKAVLALAKPAAADAIAEEILVLAFGGESGG